MTCFFENGPERMFWIHEQLMTPLMSKTGKKKKKERENKTFTATEWFCCC